MLLNQKNKATLCCEDVIVQTVRRAETTTTTKTTAENKKKNRTEIVTSVCLCVCLCLCPSVSLRPSVFVRLRPSVSHYHFFQLNPGTCLAVDETTEWQQMLLLKIHCGYSQLGTISHIVLYCNSVWRSLWITWNKHCGCVNRCSH